HICSPLLLVYSHSHHLYHSTTSYLFFFFMSTSTSEIYTLSLHDALPISSAKIPNRSTTRKRTVSRTTRSFGFCGDSRRTRNSGRSEEHTSELQSRFDLVCRLLLEKKKDNEQGIERKTIYKTQSRNIQSNQ